MSEETKAPAKNKPKKRRRPNSNRKKTGSSTGPAQSSGAPPRRNNNKKRRSGNKKNNSHKGPKLSGLERLIVKYENLRDQHIEARRKYYDLFDRADPQQKDKLERVFTNTMVKLREFENNLKPEDKKLFDQHYNGLKPDLIYSENHQLDPDGDPTPPVDAEYDDPHYLESQKDSDFSDDNEESIGSIEDYNDYKGL